MPTQQTTYNSRVTDESLEKKFRDTFKSQGGSELIDDLYASGVIVPVVDFTAAAEGSALRSDLQTAWDFSTGFSTVNTTTFTSLISTPGFWQVDFTLSALVLSTAVEVARIRINDGTTNKLVWSTVNYTAAGGVINQTLEEKFVVFLRSGDTLEAQVQNTNQRMQVWYRQIADVSGNLVNPFGFTSS